VTLATLRQGIALLGVPAPVGDPMLATARVAFAFVVPPTVGAWLILAGCVAHRVGDRSGADRSTGAQDRTDRSAGTRSTVDPPGGGTDD